jgi:uncharacterized protein (DUF983 family)
MPTRSTLSAMLHQLCPRCREGRIFRKSIFAGFPAMHQHCPACGLKFEREEGYFLGAMYIGYGLGLVAIVGFGVILWLITRWPPMRVTLWAVVLFLPLAPALTLFSRVLWIFLDQSFDPEKIHPENLNDN